MPLPLLMVSRCSHRISPAVQSDVKSRKASRSRPHSSLPCRPLRSEARQWSPNSAWHQSSQWLTSHSDHRVGSGHIYKRIDLELRMHHMVTDDIWQMKYVADGSSGTLWKVTGDSLLGEASEGGLHRLAEDLLTGRGEGGDVQRVQLLERNKISRLFPFLLP